MNYVRALPIFTKNPINGFSVVNINPPWDKSGLHDAWHLFDGKLADTIGSGNNWYTQDGGPYYSFELRCDEPFLFDRISIPLPNDNPGTFYVTYISITVDGVTVLSESTRLGARQIWTRDIANPKRGKIIRFTFKSSTSWMHLTEINLLIRDTLNYIQIDKALYTIENDKLLLVGDIDVLNPVQLLNSGVVINQITPSIISQIKLINDKYKIVTMKRGNTNV